MEKFLEEKIELTIDNYRVSKEYLRNDGDLLNHFASLVYANHDMRVPTEKVKEIRRYIKGTSARMSVFRGELLYIISILISRSSNNYEEKINNMYLVFDKLLDEGFKESEYTALMAYVISEYSSIKKLDVIIYRTKEVFEILKERYYAITKEDDYLVCALWALNEIDVETISEFIETIYKHFEDFNIKSKNGVQGITNSIILTESSGHMYRTMELLSKLDERKIKIAHQFLPLLGVLADLKPRRYVDMIGGVVEYLCDVESEYQFYIDKGFRNIIAMLIISYSFKTDKSNYMDELLAHSIYCFSRVKNSIVLTEAASFE